MKFIEKFGFFIPIVIVGVVMIILFLSKSITEIPPQISTPFPDLQQATPRSTEEALKKCDQWMVGVDGICLRINDWCQEKLGKHSIGKKELNVDPIIRQNPKFSCACEDGYQFSEHLPVTCIRACGPNECTNEDVCEKLPKHALCNTDMFAHQTGDGWRCNNGYVRRDGECVNSVDVALYCMDKYGVHSRMNTSGECVCAYGYHLDPIWINGPIQCVLNGSTIPRMPPPTINPDTYIQPKPIYVKPYELPDIPKAPHLQPIPRSVVPDRTKSPSDKGFTCYSRPGLSEGSVITECD